MLNLFQHPYAVSPECPRSGRIEGRKESLPLSHNPKPTMKPTPVVTVFITCRGKIALFKRSDKVGTYRGAWAGVAGYIERLPLQQAYVELREEAGLGPDDVALRGMGVPVIVKDVGLGRTWAVYPFLFEIADPDKITLDWEADEIRWIEPPEMGTMSTVPGLDRALAAVWPPFADAGFWSDMAEIAVDTVSGATSLAMDVLEVIDHHLISDPSAPIDRLAAAVASCRPAMGIFAHLAARLLKGESAAALTQVLIGTTHASARNASEAISGFDRILTHSYSGAVRDTLPLRRPKEIILTESRPGNEGMLLAEFLASQGLRVTVITDAQAGLFVREVDAVLLGCDAITNSDEIANKAGTSLIAMAAQEADVPCIAVTQSLKVLPVGVPYLNEEQDPGRVGSAEGVRFRNTVFDLTPMSRLTAIYTEDGALTRERLAAIRTYIGSFTYSFGGG